MNLQYHIHESTIKCPYCDCDCRDDDYEVAQDFDDRIEFECQSCERIFWAEASIVYSTHSDCALNDEKHDWENSGHHPTVFNCKNCSQYEVRERRE